MTIIDRQAKRAERCGSLLQTAWIAAATVAGGLVGLILFWNFGPIAWAVVSVGFASVLFGLFARKRSL